MQVLREEVHQETSPPLWELGQRWCPGRRGERRGGERASSRFEERRALDPLILDNEMLPRLCSCFPYPYDKRGPKIRNIETEPRIATRFAPSQSRGDEADGTRWEGKGVPSHPHSESSAGNSSGNLDQDPANRPC